MTVLSDRLSYLMQQRTEWLSKRAQVIVENIANSDMPRARRKELTSFSTILHNSLPAHSSSGKKFKDVRNVKISDNNIKTTDDEISREQEMMLLTRNTADHDGLINVVKSFHKMYRSVLSKS
jgi:flagellar basal body rod protein FlgB